MILLVGDLADGPLTTVVSTIRAMSVPYLFANPNDGKTTLEFQIEPGVITGVLCCPGGCCRLEDVTGVYLRVGGNNARDRRPQAAFYETLMEWCQIAAARVVTRPIPAASNSSKPYQAQLIQAHGLAVPDTIISNDVERIVAFMARHRSVVYKSMSATRSIVRLLDGDGLGRLDRVTWCPTQFQEYVEGLNVRVHVVGSELFATAIRSDAVDYRYPALGDRLSLSASRLPDDLEATCIRLASALDLPFAGIDLKITPGGRVFCFEVNPSPGFTYYENQTGQPIARSLVKYLSGGGTAAPSGTTVAVPLGR